ncbi:MAG: hypothetical protein BWY57_02450 [Betaproteobacteria bacterium ADurb.Bin341]|nr:MAG: hypothetical protein BWY57_02450 [Betaproteobacteria bacterium ADurb.Bin341]
MHTAGNDQRQAATAIANSLEMEKWFFGQVGFGPIGGFTAQTDGPFDQIVGMMGQPALRGHRIAGEQQPQAVVFDVVADLAVAF